MTGPRVLEELRSIFVSSRGRRAPLQRREGELPGALTALATCGRARRIWSPRGAAEPFKIRLRCLGVSHAVRKRRSSNFGTRVRSTRRFAGFR